MNGNAGGAKPSLATEALLARHILRQRRRREQVLGHHFSDPAWDMILDLFASQALGEQTATFSLIVAAMVPQTTAMRRIRTLVLDGIFLEQPDPKDGRRTFILLSPSSFDAMADLLHEWRRDLPGSAIRFGDRDDAVD